MKVKLKGRYDHDKAWHQDPSALIIPKAAKAAIVAGVDVRQFIMGHTDPFDFMMRAKATKGAHLVMVNDDKTETPLQKTTRFFVSIQGGSIFKNAPPPEGETEGWFKRAPKVSKAAYAAWHAANGNVHNPEIHTKNGSKYDTRRTGMIVGWKTTECNRAERFDWGNLNREYYITEAMKLVDAVR